MIADLGSAPSRRWWVLALLFLITVINFVDRQSLSVVAPVLRDTLSLSASDYGRIVSAFQTGMMLGEFPMGWLMDRRGARFGFTVAVLWWSLANGLHVIARTMPQFAALRFMLGTGECGNYPGAMKVVSQWFPVRERALAVGVFNSGSMIGSLIALPFLTVLMLQFGWPWAFLLPSALGGVWVILWRGVYRDLAERGDAGQRAPRASELLRLRATWGVVLCRLLVGPVVQFYLYWLPEYLYRERHLSLKEIGMFAWLPFLFGDAGSIGGGWVAGVLIKRGVGVGVARAITMGFGAACCLSSLAVFGAGSTAAAMAWICVVLFGHTFLSANMFAVISDLFPANAVGRVTAMTGIAGGLSGMLFPLLTGFLVDRVSYAPVFAMAAVMPSAGCLILFWVGRPSGGAGT
jgi:ACS family hexuronate transporter-like MFS transporter